MRRIHRLVLALAASASIGYAFAQSSAQSSGYAISDETLTPMAALYGGASSSPGRAMRAPSDPRPGTVIGKAMQRLENGEGQITMLVMLR